MTDPFQVPADWIVLEPRRPEAAALRISIVELGRQKTRRLQLNLAPALFEELGAPARVTAAFSPTRFWFRVKADAAGAFEVLKPTRGNVRLIRVPLPPQLVGGEADEPEHWVDQIGKQLIVEVPPQWLPPPPLPPGELTPVQVAAIKRKKSHGVLPTNIAKEMGLPVETVKKALGIPVGAPS